MSRPQHYMTCSWVFNHDAGLSKYHPAHWEDTNRAYLCGCSQEYALKNKLLAATKGTWNKLRKINIKNRKGCKL